MAFGIKANGAFNAIGVEVFETHLVKRGWLVMILSGCYGVGADTRVGARQVDGQYLVAAARGRPDGVSRRVARHHLVPRVRRG